MRALQDGALPLNTGSMGRLYREEGLRVRKRGGRKRALGTRRPMVVPGGPNKRWSMDFVSDAFHDGRRFGLRAAVDDDSRECLALVADTSLSGARAAREPDAIIAVRGRPTTVVSDDGTEFISMAIPTCCQRTKIDRPCIAPGRPARDTPSSSLDGRLRDELPNETLSGDLRQARGAVRARRQDDDTCRPHSAPGNAPPAEFVAQIGLDEKVA